METTFRNEPGLTTISLPKATSIGASAFALSSLNSLSLPQVKTIGDGAFTESPLTSLSLPKVISIGDDTFHIINNPKSKITLSKIFNTPSEKDRIFGKDHWDQISFAWV